MSRVELNKYFPDVLQKIILSYTLPNKAEQKKINRKRRRCINIIKREGRIFKDDERNKFIKNFFLSSRADKLNKEVTDLLIRARYTECTKKLNGLTLRCYEKNKLIGQICDIIKTDRYLKTDYGKNLRYYDFVIMNHGSCIELTTLKKRCRNDALMVDGRCKKHYQSKKKPSYHYYNAIYCNDDKKKMEKLYTDEFKMFYG